MHVQQNIKVYFVYLTAAPKRDTGVKMVATDT